MAKAEDFVFATAADARLAREQLSYGYGGRSHVIDAEETPWGIHPSDLSAKLGFPPNVNFQPVHLSHMDSSVFFQTRYDYSRTGTHARQKTDKYDKLLTMPFLVTVRRLDGHEDQAENFKFSDTLRALVQTAREPAYLGNRNYSGYSYHSIMHQANIFFTVEYGGVRFPILMPFSIAEQIFGLEITPVLQLRLSSGAEEYFHGWPQLLENCHVYRRSGRSYDCDFDFTLDTLAVVGDRSGMGPTNLERLLVALVERGTIPGELAAAGAKKTWNRLSPVVAELLKTDPMAVCAYRTLANNCHISVDGVKISSVFNETFKDVQDGNQLVAAVKGFRYWEEGQIYFSSSHLDEAVKQLPVYREKRKAVLKSQANRAFAKIQEDAENLTIDRKKHRCTWAEVEAGHLPLGAFFRKSESYFLLNDNWDLWEEMYRRGHGEIANQLAQEVKGRTTYEKDLMSYFYFVLHGLPSYLKRHTGQKWSCLPKLVNTQEELEPPAEDNSGVSRKRSALTPTVDNLSRVVTVPYASLAIGGGFGTTYCYSHDYHVLTEGFSFNGYAVTDELGVKLNSRDDYGLMFYTLTGSAQGRGYPTFLVIFERRGQKGDTRVHFHRTHPCRSKEGEYAPIHHWVRNCYNWMCGNVNREHIAAQQGDLFFVRVNADGQGGTVRNLKYDYQVNQYDGHQFERPVAFAENDKAAKDNVLGYVLLDEPTWLRHGEHDDVQIPSGEFAIRQCRSWEANPKGVWSLRID